MTAHNLRRVRWLLTCWYVGVLLAIVLLMTGVAYFGLVHELRGQLDESLQGTAGGRRCAQALSPRRAVRERPRSPHRHRSTSPWSRNRRLPVRLRSPRG